MDKVEKQLLMAEQQITGFLHAQSGGDIYSLISAMGVSYIEWCALAQSGEVDYLGDDLINDITKRLYDGEI